MSDVDSIMTAIQLLVAIKIGKSVTWNEVEEIYSSKMYPAVNKEIDYVLGY